MFRRARDLDELAQQVKESRGGGKAGLAGQQPPQAASSAAANRSRVQAEGRMRAEEARTVRGKDRRIHA